MAELREKLIGIDSGLILNMDEAALFYQLAPTSSYVLSRDARETRGTALQSAEARITVMFLVNTTGTFKFLSVDVAAVVRELLDGAPAARDPPVNDDAHAIVGMLHGARSLGPDTTDNGCGAAHGDLLVSGDDPNALRAVQVW